MKNCVVLFELSICGTPPLPRQALPEAQLRSILDEAMVEFSPPTDFLLSGWVVGTKVLGAFKSLKPLASVPKETFESCFYSIKNGRKYKGKLIFIKHIYLHKFSAKLLILNIYIFLRYNFQIQ